jgi:Protein of unknown function (DUF2946)
MPHNEAMDDIVKAALLKWPNVPNCFGWLGLSARGDWYMRDDRAQAAGPFADAVVAAAASAQPRLDPGLRAAAKGALLRHEKLTAFIARNYSSDAHGQWFFQNGPQRVYVELEVAPFVWRVAEDFSITAHTGESVRVQRCVVDELGRVFLETDLGFGLVHTQDVVIAADAVEQGLWVPQQALAADLAQRFGFIVSPQENQNS